MDGKKEKVAASVLRVSKENFWTGIIVLIR